MLYCKINFKIDINNDELLKTILKLMKKIKSWGGGEEKKILSINKTSNILEH